MRSARLLRFDLFVLLLTSVLAASGADGAWVFRGFCVLGEGREFVSLADASGGARWIPVGNRVDGHRIARLDRAGGVVTLVAPDGRELAVPLQGATVGDVKLRPATPDEARRAAADTAARVKLPGSAHRGDPTAPLSESEIVDIFPAPGSTPSAEQLDWAWIRSDENPMREMATLPSRAESAKWGRLTAAERADLVELYRQCGWAITVFVKRNGLVAAAFQPIARPGQVAAGSGGAGRAAVGPPD